MHVGRRELQGVDHLQPGPCRGGQIRRGGRRVHGRQDRRRGQSHPHPPAELRTGYGAATPRTTVMHGGGHAHACVLCVVLCVCVLRPTHRRPPCGRSAWVRRGCGGACGAKVVRPEPRTVGVGTRTSTCPTRLPPVRAPSPRCVGISLSGCVGHGVEALNFSGTYPLTRLVVTDDALLGNHAQPVG